MGSIGAAFWAVLGWGDLAWQEIADLSLTAYWAKEMHLFGAKNKKCATLVRRRGYLKSNGRGVGMVWHPSIHQMREFETRNTQIHAGLSLPGGKHCVAQNEGFGNEWEGQNRKCEM